MGIYFDLLNLNENYNKQKAIFEPLQRTNVKYQVYYPQLHEALLVRDSAVIKRDWVLPTDESKTTEESPMLIGNRIELPISLVAWRSNGLT